MVTRAVVTRDASSLQRSLTWSRAAASAHRRSWRLPEHYFYHDNLSDQVLFVARLSCSTEHDCPVAPVLNASTTRWPSAPNPRAISSPMPRLAPVASTAGRVSGVTADCTSARLRGASHPMIGVDETPSGSAPVRAGLAANADLGFSRLVCAVSSDHI